MRTCFKASTGTNSFAPEGMYYSISWTTAPPSGLTPGQIAAIVSCVVIFVAAIAGAVVYYFKVFKPRRLAAAIKAGGGGGLAAQDENAIKGMNLRASSGGAGEEPPKRLSAAAHDSIPHPAPAPANQQV